MLVVGQKEKDSNTVSVRSRNKGDAGVSDSEEFMKKMQEEIALKTY